MRQTYGHASTMDTNTMGQQTQWYGNYSSYEQVSEPPPRPVYYRRTVPEIFSPQPHVPCDDVNKSSSPPTSPLLDIDGAGGGISRHSINSSSAPHPTSTVTVVKTSVEIGECSNADEDSIIRSYENEDARRIDSVEYQDSDRGDSRPHSRYTQHEIDSKHMDSLHDLKTYYSADDGSKLEAFEDTEEMQRWGKILMRTRQTTGKRKFRQRGDSDDEAVRPGARILEGIMFQQTNIPKPTDLPESTRPFNPVEVAKPAEMYHPAEGPESTESLPERNRVPEHARVPDYPGASDHIKGSEQSEVAASTAFLGSTEILESTRSPESTRPTEAFEEDVLKEVSYLLDAPTEYSASNRTDLPPVHEAYVSEFAQNVFQRLQADGLSTKDLERISGVLADNLKGFATRLGLDAEAQMHRDIVYFAYKRRRQACLNLIWFTLLT